jgi:hypothetical protein
MKLRTVKGEWIITDEGKEIKFGKGSMTALYYVFLMRDLRRYKMPLINRYAVRSLVPHPKKRRFTRKWREKVNSIKHREKMGEYSSESNS